MNIINKINSRLRYKLMLASTIISFLVIVVSYLGLRTINNIENEYLVISRQSVPVIMQLEKMNSACLRLISSATEYAFLQTTGKNNPRKESLEQEKGLILSSCKSCHAAFAEYKKLVKGAFAEESEHAKDISESAIVLQIKSNEFIELSKKGKPASQLLEKKEEMEEAEISFLNTVDISINHITNKLEKEKLRLDSLIESSYRHIITFGLAALLFSILVGFLFSKTITKPLVQLTNHAKNFRKGNLDADFPITSIDEVGILGKSFKEMSERIKLLVSQLENEVNITRQAEAELLTLNQRMEMLMTSSSTMIYACEAFGDFDAKFISGNFSSITGYPNEDFYQKKWWAGKIHPEDVPQVFKNIEEIFNTGRQSLEYRFRFKDGSWHWMHDELKLVNDYTGKPKELIGTWQDVSRQKLAEEALKKSEKSYRTLTENLPAAVYRLYLRERGKMEFFNNIIEQITGYSKGELHNGNICSIDPFILAEDKQRVVETVSNAIKNQKEFEVDYRFNHKDGCVKYFYEKGIPVYGDDGKPIYIDGVIFDNTDRKLAEEALRLSEKTYRDFANFLPQPVFEFDLNGRFTFVNQATQETSGYTKEELEGGLTFYDLTDPKHHKKLNDAMKNRLDNVPSTGTEIIVIRKDGTSFPAIGFTSPIKTDGKPEGLRGIIIDITERKKHDAFLKQNAARFRMLYELARKIASTLELDKILKKAVKQIHQNFNYNHVAILTYEDENNILILKAIEGDFVKLLKTETQIELKKGIILWAAQTGNIAIANDVKLDPHYVNLYPDMIKTRSELSIPLKIGVNVFGILDIQSNKINAFSEDDINVLVTIADQIALAINNSLLYENGQLEINKRKQAESETKKKNEELIKLNAEKDKFFSIIAHDLRSPFQGLLGLTNMVATGDEEFTMDDFRTYCKSIHDSSYSLFKLIENLLAWAQMQRGTMSFEPISIDLNDIILKGIETIKNRSTKKAIQIINKVGEKTVYSDENMLNSVIRNLLSNAVKFTKRGGKITIKSEDTNDGMVKVSVADTGVGIPEYDLRKLFKLEEKVRSKGTEGEPSTGLGLILCKEFIVRNGGQIWAESEENKGSTFYFTIPLAREEKTA